MFFMCIKMLSFLLFFACMCFVLFVRVKSSCKKKIIIKRFKTALIPSFTILLTCTPLKLPQVICTHLFLFMIICENLSLLWESFLLMTISFYLWSSVVVFSFYCLWESFLIYDRLWKFFPFMRIFLNFFLFMIICENLFLFMINYFITYYFLSH